MAPQDKGGTAAVGCVAIATSDDVNSVPSDLQGGRKRLSISHKSKRLTVDSHCKDVLLETSLRARTTRCSNVDGLRAVVDAGQEAGHGLVGRIQTRVNDSITRTFLLVSWISIQL